MIDVTVLEAMAAEGATVAMVIAAVKAAQAIEQQKIDVRRAKDAERKRRERGRHAESRGQPVKSRGVTRSHADSLPPLFISKKESKGESKKETVCEPKKVHIPNARAFLLPPDWTLDDDGRAYARQKHGWDDQRIDDEAERFRDYALSNGRRQVDWKASWRRWVMSPYRKNQPQTNGVPHGRRAGSVLDAFDRLHEKLKAAGATGDYIPGSSGPIPLEELQRGQSNGLDWPVCPGGPKLISSR
jgi:hypothetical protein